ncbi:hypothetical protein F511_15272 [Dorcoceras hygrometricum]|uniref:Uncharacterized protein n=1 Tax=Dorcoceras hygrometricum TaxID=472368 RepID=A0A2Z7ALG6_9LAMI|nr:hypothetical protein F511_15272 [Dorcoceras hygrometricum]
MLKAGNTLTSKRGYTLRSVANSIDSVNESLEVKEPWLPDQAKLGSSSLPWYEEKSSNLRLSDISLIKENGGMLDKFEVVLPHPDERAHRPPPGFHTFYMNQIDMGLKFPIPKFISSLCQHIKISPSQLAPNSYSFLLALAVILLYHNIPLTPYVLMQLVQIKRLGPGKFYLSHKGDHTFIKGNPSSQKGWMSRFFYVKRAGNNRNPWRCEMSWRDNLYTFTPRTPERSPNLTYFLDAMRDKSFSALELIKEDLLCFFGFSRKGVGLIGDLDRRMGKVEMLKAWDEAKELSLGAAAPPKKEMAWGGGEVIKRLTRAHRAASDTRQHFDETIEHCTELEMRLAELEAMRADEERAAEAQRVEFETQRLRLEAEKEVIRSELNAALAKKTAVEVELDKTKARAAKEIERLKGEATHAWDLGKEVFLETSEFDKLCAKKSVAFFKTGFDSCLAQFRANDYSEEEHPAPFLSVRKALAELPDEDEEADEEEEEEDDADATPPSSPKP